VRVRADPVTVAEVPEMIEDAAHVLEAGDAERGVDSFVTL
jgi:hypothetical protein